MMSMGFSSKVQKKIVELFSFRQYKFTIVEKKMCPLIISSVSLTIEMIFFGHFRGDI